MNPLFLDVFLGLGMVLTLNDNDKLGISIAFLLNVIKNANGCLPTCYVELIGSLVHIYCHPIVCYRKLVQERKPKSTS